MSVRVFVPPSLRDLSAGEAVVELADTATVAEALEGLFERHDGLRLRIVDERGALRPHVAIFVGGRSVHTGEGLAASVEPGDEVTILPAVSGG